jgi:hypothetical protein
MDPYLEQRGLWEQVHADLIVDIRRFLTPLVRPHYHVAIEQRYLAVLPPDQQAVGIPDALVISHSPGVIFSLRDPIPTIPIPLRPGETEPVLNLNQILHNLYDQGGYDLAVDYHQPLVSLAGGDYSIATHPQPA